MNFTATEHTQEYDGVKLRPTDYNFKAVERLKGVNSVTMPDNIFRLGKASYSLSPNLFRHYGVKRTTKSGARWTNVHFDFDRVRLAIRILPNDGGFAASIDDNNRLTGAIPGALKRSGMPMGDYELVDDKNMIFVLR